jgi:hypothetical protein
VDGSGNARMVGNSSCSESTFPVNVGPDLTDEISDDAFVAKVYESPILKPRHAVAHFDGDGADEAAVDFGTMGVWMNDSGVWTQINPDDPE